MADLTAEQIADRRRTMAEFRSLFQDRLRYPYQQHDLLTSIGSAKSEGVCFAMCLDWLRRHMWNAYAPLKSRKRSFDDPKFKNSPEAQKKLTRKHASWQAAIEGVGNPSLQKVRVFVDAIRAVGVKTLGLHGLDSEMLVTGAYTGSDGNEHETNPNPPLSVITCDRFLAHQKFAGDLTKAMAIARAQMQEHFAPAVGLLPAITGPSDVGSHAVMIFIDHARLLFFDPNLGEYAFDARDGERFVSFVTSLWFLVYHRFHRMDTVTFNVVTYSKWGVGEMASGYPDGATLQRVDSLNFQIKGKR